jgi:sec-independent protein translocase protein TatA
MLPLLAPLGLGPLEIGLILVIIVIVFGVGRLPEVGGAIGKGIREFRKASHDDEAPSTDMAATAVGPDASVASSAATVDAAGAAAASDAIFCGECGARNDRANKFCSQCGHAIGAAVS